MRLSTVHFEEKEKAAYMFPVETTWELDGDEGVLHVVSNKAVKEVVHVSAFEIKIIYEKLGTQPN